MGGGCQESVDNNKTTMTGNNKKHKRAADEEGSDKEGEGGKCKCE